MSETSPHCGPANSDQAGMRIVLAKVGLDGHDRGIKVVARGLRDAGFHVIYSGLWQSPEAVAQIVADEDAVWLGVGLLNGAHLTLIPRVVKAIQQIGRPDVGLIVGGIIPAVDVATLKASGVHAIFGPGTPIAEIVQSLTPRPASPFELASLLDRSREHDRVATSRLLTAVANAPQREAIRERLNAVAPTIKRPWRIAVTGSPGVGKSTLIAQVIKSLKAQASRRIAVLACDPQSPVTGGALLGDRLRMAEFLPGENLFIRSLATPSGTQGVAPHLDVMEQILAWAGFDLLIIETVGVGQGEIAVRSVADQVVLVLQPQTGDSVQWDKAGVWELADLVVVQKCDLPGADGMLASLREQLTRPGSSPLPIFGVSSHSPNGWDELLAHLGTFSQTAS